jgi:hypothetical protein
VLDDLHKHLLDVIEFFFEIYIVDVRQVFTPGMETIWQRKSLLIPNEPPHLMDGVVGMLGLFDSCLT